MLQSKFAMLTLYILPPVIF